MNALAKSILLSFPLFFASVSAQFSINFSFADPLTPDQQTAFTNAASTWEGLIEGYQPGVGLSGIDVTVATSGGPTDSTKQFIRQGYVITDEARVFVGTDTLTNLDLATLELFFTREIGTAIGIGSLWEVNGLYSSGSGEYTGTAGLAAYQTEFSQPAASFIPVELFAGTREIYWDEIDNAAGLTGITNASGQDFGDDIMTAWLGPNTADTFISQTTIQSLEDLGYSVAATSKVPEPSSLLLLFSASGLFLRRKRHH